MVHTIDRHKPQFSLWPVNNNRTAWKPFGLPTILSVPHRKTHSGLGIQNSQVFNVRIFIENVPQEARVVGHQHHGIRYPDRELYAETIDALQLADRIIDLSNVEITRDGIIIPLADAKDGDIIYYISVSGVKDTIEYYIGTDYYDLSDIKLDVELLPSDDYNIVYSAEYYTRLVTRDEQEDFICIDISSTSLTILRFLIKHPGPILDEFYRLTPPPYLTNSAKSADTTVDLYRPFTDSLQNITDEQDLLESLNWVSETPPEAIPYLSSLLGWDLPYFPESLDKLRRAVLRRTVEFQNLAGSRRAIINIFRLFGFEILISNLWWSSDGKRFIRPDEELPAPYKDEEIIIQENCQTDILLDGWDNPKTGSASSLTTSIDQASEFGVFRIPLIFRPQEKAGLDDFSTVLDGGNITIDTYFVEVGSNAELALKEISSEIKSNPSEYGDCSEVDDGFINPIDIHDKLRGKELVGYSQILITGKLGEATDEMLVGPEIPLTSNGVNFERETNYLNISLNGALDLEDKGVLRVLYLFATYKKQTIVVPEIIKNNQSNRFDIQVLTESLNEFADPITLDFAIEFLNRLKAFHSQLYVIRQRIEMTETYEVTDICVGGDIQQRYDTDIGMLQVPPAIIPAIPEDINACVLLDYKALGYKEDDIELRQRKLTNMPEEHAAWKAYDERESEIVGQERLKPAEPAPGREDCKFNYIGQDRIVQGRIESRNIVYIPGPMTNNGDAGFQKNPDISPGDVAIGGEYNTTGADVSANSDSSAYGSFTREYTEIRTPFCELDNITDYCYKGRVDDELLHRPTVVANEYIRCHPCSISVGSGVYWTFPSISVMATPGHMNASSNSKSQVPLFSGGADQSGIMHFTDGPQGENLTVSYDVRLPAKNDNFYGRLCRDFDTPVSTTLHFTNRRIDFDWDQRQHLALERPNIEISKINLHLPGCRFPMMYALENDFVSDVWRARPWDDQYSDPCGPISTCHSEPTYLNVDKTTDDDGNEFLVFDDVPYSIAGNNLIPDIPSLGDHALQTGSSFSESDAIHKVYMKDADLNPAVVFDQVCEYDGDVIDGIISVDNPIFSSYGDCGTELSDFADGYGCVYGPQPYAGVDIGSYDDVLDGLGVPLGGTDNPATVLFLCGSGILDELGTRLDCGCLVINCDQTDPTDSPIDTICSADLFLDENDLYDWDCDHLRLESRLLEEETVGVCSTRVDGTIPTMLELL